MGLDINPLGKPNPGHETEFADLWTEIQIAQGKRKAPKDNNKGFMARLFSSNKPVDTTPLIERFQEISTPPFAAIDAPIVGQDEAADNWVRDMFNNGRLVDFDSADEAIQGFVGFCALDAMKVCDGFPIYSNGGTYDGVDRTSFRGDFLKDCPDVLSKSLIDQAWEPMLAEELADWGKKMRTEVDAFAEKHNITHVLGDREYPWPDEGTPEYQAHIVDQAARWALWWSDRGHGSDPFF